MLTMVQNVYADLSVHKHAGCSTHVLTLEVNQHRLTQSSLVSTPGELKQDRHKFLLERLGRYKAGGKQVKEPHRKVQVVSVEQLAPKPPAEPRKYTLNPVVDEENAKIKFNWTIMPPVKSSITYRFGAGDSKFSRGVVYKIKTDQVVNAPIAGDVIFSGVMKEFEHVIMIEKDLENVILVAGVSNSNIKAGDKVYRGQKIGAVVKGGWIYVEFRNAGNPIDPQQVLASGSVNEE